MGMKDKLDKDRAWVILGDFNMITEEEDQTGGNYVAITRAEKETWEELVDALKLVDTFKREPEGRRFSWDNMHRRMEQESSPESSTTTSHSEADRPHPGRVLKRLDRIYIGEELTQYQEKYEIGPGSNQSDHSPVYMSLLDGDKQESPKARYCINVSLLRNAEFKDKLAELWTDLVAKGREKGDTPEQILRRCMREVSRAAKARGKLVAKEKRAKWEETRGRISLYMQQLEGRPQDEELQSKLQEAKDCLEEMEQARATWIQQKIDTKWIVNGDLPSKVFFGLFKSRQKQLKIECLINEGGAEVSEEEEMKRTAENHFRRLLSESIEDDERLPDIRRVLEMTGDRVTEEERSKLELPLTKEELRQAAVEMKKGRSPGPDGTPVEFFVKMWATTGELVVQVITRGAERGWFPGWFNRGDVVLLPKGGDTRDLSNKRPITLMNSIYKIYTKALQRRVVPVLQRLINWNQSAFLPGRNIHTSVLTCNEAVHEAVETGQDYILLQLDFKKAFDSVSWRFLMKTLAALNFSNRFQKYIRAILTTAASSILINGTRSRPVKVTRSVRQGCPLSPLLFILVTQTLTAAVEWKVNKSSIHGIYLQKANVHYCLGMYADDSHMIIRATRECANNTRELLDTFAAATGLQIQWNKSMTRWIGPNEDSKPQWATELAWSWKAKGESTSLLGFSFEVGVKADDMLRKCKEKINEVCSNRLYSNLSICGRVTIANATLLGVFWYLIPLWAGSFDDLQKLEKKIVNFVWCGNSLDTRYRAATAIITQGVREGGLGLISLTKQYLAFAARTMRWAFQPGKHPLQTTIRTLVERESLGAFGVPGVQWLYSAAKARLPGTSKVMQNVFVAWEQLKKLIKQGTLHIVEDWHKLPIWGNSQEAKDGKIRRIDTAAKRTLWEVGYRSLEDLTEVDGKRLATWESRRIQGDERRTVRAAFMKLMANIRGPQETVLDGETEVERFFTTEEVADGIWRWKIKGKQKYEKQSPPTAPAIVQKFKKEGSRITIDTSTDRANMGLVYKPLDVVTFAGGHGKKILASIEDVPEGAEELKSLKWENGGAFFTATNSQIRRMLTSNRDLISEKIKRWSGVAEVNYTHLSRWSKIWRARRARRECFLLWSICFKIVPTNSWRFPSLPRADPQRWCRRCSNQSVEDTFHVFWGCDKAQSTWKTVEGWVASITGGGRRWRLKCSHILLAETIPKELKKHSSWWEALRGATIWGIWMARNACNFNNESWHAKKTEGLIWYRFSIYIRSEWRVLKAAERDEFKAEWLFELSGIVIDSSGNLDLPRRAPWWQEDAPRLRTGRTTTRSRIPLGQNT